MDDQPTTLLTPINPLTIRNGAPPAEKFSPTPSDRFLLFGNSWLDMQTAVSASLALPISMGDFATKYGSFPAIDQGIITGCVSSMTEVQNLSKRFGNPTTIKQQLAVDGTFLTSVTPPDPIYGHIIWLAGQIENAASTFTSTFSYLGDVLSPSAGTPAQRAENLRALLTGPGGLASTADEMHSKAAALSSKLALFDGDLGTAADGIMKYSAQDSQIMAAADDLLGKLNKDIEDLRKSADEAYIEWRNYTIAAVTTSVGITILSFGMLWWVGAALGVGLGIAAAKQMTLYNSLMGQVRDKKADVLKKTQLTTDLLGLNTSIPGLVSSVSDFKTKLSEIEGVWINIGANLGYIASNYTDTQLSNLPFVIQATKVLDAQTKWQAISDTAKDFTQHSLVSYSSSEFGSSLPSL